MKPRVDFEVLDAVDHEHILSVRVFGTNHRGEVIDEVITLPEPRAIDEIAGLVAKVNRGQYRA